MSFQVYIRDVSGDLTVDRLYTLEISNLHSHSSSSASINGVAAEVDYLVTLETALDISMMNGGLYVGGYGTLEHMEVGTVY